MMKSSTKSSPAELPRLSYLCWIKRKMEAIRGTDVVNLASSGMSSSFADDWLKNALDRRAGEIIQRMAEPNPFGLESLKQAIRRAYRIPASHRLICTSGASGAIRLLSESILAGRPGAEVIVETPVYEPLERIPDRMGAKVVPADRNSWFVSIISALSENTAAVLISNPHNPTGHAVPADKLVDLADELQRRSPRAVLIVDETFGDLGPWPGSSMAAVDRRMISIGTLSKLCGLGSLRCGWIACAPNRLPCLDEDAVLFQNVGCQLAEVIGAMALDEIDKFRDVAFQQLAQNRQLVAQWIDDMAAASLVQSQDVPSGTILFPRLLHCNGSDATVDRLQTEFGVLVTPGHFFGDGNLDRVRIGMGGSVQQLASGLTRLSTGLEAI